MQHGSSAPGFTRSKLRKDPEPSVSSCFDRAGEEDARRLRKVCRIPCARRLIGRMHGQLGQADVDRIHGDLALGDISQRRSSDHVRPVGKGLPGDARLLTDPAEDRAGDRA